MPETQIAQAVQLMPAARDPGGEDRELGRIGTGAAAGHVANLNAIADTRFRAASYARQSEDDTLLKAVMRIKARAIERCGELLQEIPAAKTGGAGGGAPTGAVGRMRAARDAGLSRDRPGHHHTLNLPRKKGPGALARVLPEGRS